MSKNIRALSSRQGLENNLFDLLGATIQSDTEKSDAAMTLLAEEASLSASVIKGTASFYDFLNEQTKNSEVLVCHGTACLVNGSAAETATRHPHAGKAMCCGYCYRGAGLLKREVDGRLDGYHQGDDDLSRPEMPVYCLSPSAILTGPVDSLEELYRIALDKRDEILPQLERSKLRGRGGAGFGFAFKCRATAEAQSSEKYVVCNADEGDPGAFSDRYLLEQQPHKVMAGMYAAGVAADASTGVLYIRREYPAAIRRVEAAIAEFDALPDQISRNFSFQIIEGAGSYVCGEETALLSSIEGQRPEVRVRPPFPATHGLWGKPTLLSNVETFANISWILQQGGEAYAAIGTGESKGTKLISLDSQFAKPGLYEVDFGYRFSDLIFRHAGGFETGVKALQVGGPLGSIIPLAAIDSLTVDFESFQRAGFALGHAGIIAIPKHFPMIDFMRHIIDYMADESCGKCTPCRLGTAKGSHLLEQASADNPLNSELFDELLELLEAGSLCALGSGIPLPMRNALTHFHDELSPYFTA
ncbi:MAG: NAD(P)H-dependent oxidoreductase subunit E [gamma proteobacterium endosymbiont of Lamellibrachia anaximandri]|nr:NAD(P)H-dependent oxidoreductase subunit E [gamma proteobacterium endosymbiont of Lamellibrachia anaximandri]MBL3617856.1 NAD(P)H-dependent oxidoreductase subunit E [gamma proteobacterium endosymbiont of Lamellibrachia anaximandri]